MSDTLPILDVSWCDTHQDDEPFLVLNPQNAEDDERLGQSLGVPRLIDGLAQQARECDEKMHIFGHMEVVSQTEEGEVIVVALQLAVMDDWSHGHWVGFVCLPQHCDQLERSVKNSITRYRDYIENTV